MRFILKKYGSGRESFYETSVDGGDFVRQLRGKHEVGARISVLIEASWAETDQGADRLLEAIDWLSDEIRKRKANWSPRKKTKKKAARKPARGRKAG
ncbi:MAG TPA: hypothetical protein VJ783_01835 [Pirellulales bacterium]|nr:hypothetical protein [Pirellulales bacterium]